MVWAGASRAHLLAAASAVGLLLSAGAAMAAPALPTGGSVAAGSASIATSGSSLTISQSTPKAIIDWQGFSIGQGGSVRFNNGSGATLNRVTGTSGSSIDGLLSGTGSVYLINPNGVIVGKSGVVNVGGSFVASTLDVPDASFLSGGDLTFSGSSTAAVVNEGKVGSLGGDVVLVASSVSNAGSLSAPNGTVGLLAGQSVLLRDQALDDGKFSVLVGGSSTSATNSGLIEAANAELRANGGNIYALAGNTAGVINATGVNQGDGHVWLIAEGGALDVAGTIAARGPNGSGGTIETSGGDVTIGASSIDAGVGGTWLVDQVSLTIDGAAATTIDNALNAGTSVVERTTATGASGYGVKDTSGYGDILVEAPIAWTTSAKLTLSAYRNLVVDDGISLTNGALVLTAGTENTGPVGKNQGSIAINAPISVSQAGAVTITAAEDTLTAPGTSLLQVAFAGPGAIDFGPTNMGGQLTINHHAYSLAYSLADLAAMSGASVTYNALATNLTAPSSAYGHSIVSAYAGVFEGLGHTISDLQISSSDSRVGLFATLNSGGVIRDLGLPQGSTSSTSNDGQVGALVGFNLGGTIANVYGSQSVVGSFAGGLAGINSGLIINATNTGPTTGLGDNVIGGLVGENTGKMIDVTANGAVTAGQITINANVIGGLVGANYGSIDNGYASGDIVSSDAVGSNAPVNGVLMGGLVGLNTGTIVGSHASGALSAVTPYGLGGLVGEDQGGSISGSYATGSVSGSQISNRSGYFGGLVGFTADKGSSMATISQSFASGAVSAEGQYVFVGGLVGQNGGQITDAYATGAVSYTGTVQQDHGGVGGLVGYNLGGAIQNVFATGDVFAKNSASVGGLIGLSAGATLSNGYYNTQTTGVTSDGEGAVGLTTAQLQATLPSGLSSGTWGQIAFVSYPYLLSIYPTTPQVISGIVNGAGVTPGYAVSAIVNGGDNLGSASANADLTFYFLEPAGTLPQGSTAIVYIDHEPKKGAQVVEDIGAGGSLTGLYFTAGSGVLSTRDDTLSAAIADLAKGLGPATDAAGADILFGVSGSSLTLGSQATTLDIFPGGGGFAFDQDLNLGSRALGMVNYVGPITQSAGSITVGKLGGSSTGGLSLTSSGNQIDQVVGWSDGSGSISITNGKGMQVVGAINAEGAVNLMATGGDLVIGQSVTAGSAGMMLQSSGTVTEIGSQGVVTTTGSVDVTGVGGIVMDSANVGAGLTLNNTGGGTVRYAALGSTSVSSASNAGGGPITLSTTLDSGGAGTITLTGLVSGGSVKLNSADAITETGAGAIDAVILQGSAGGPVTLNGANLIGKIYNFTSTVGDLALTDGETLTVAGLLDGTGRTVALITTAGDIIVNGTVKATTLDLTSQAGALREALNSGSIGAGTLNAVAHTGVTLTGAANQITTIGTDHTDSGPNNIQQ